MSIRITVPWPSTDVSTLRTMWADGKSAQIISDIIGCTRSAVIGKAHRLRLAPRQTTVRSPARPRRERLVLRRPRTPPVIPPTPRADAKVLRSLKLTIVEITDSQCKFPSGEHHLPYTFCGHPTFNGLPYCEGHCRAAYQSGSSQNARQRQAAADAKWAARQ